MVEIEDEIKIGNDRPLVSFCYKGMLKGITLGAICYFSGEEMLKFDSPWGEVT